MLRTGLSKGLSRAETRALSDSVSGSPICRSAIPCRLIGSAKDFVGRVATKAICDWEGIADLHIGLPDTKPYTGMKNTLGANLPYDSCSLEYRME